MSENKKRTKRENFEVLKTVVTNLDNDIQPDERLILQSFIDNEITLLSKKSKGKTTPTKTQQENVLLMDSIEEYLAEAGKPLRASDIALFLGKSTPKATSLLTALKNDNRIVRVQEGKSVTFRALTEEEVQSN